VTHDPTVDLDDPVRRRAVAPQPRPPLLEGGSIIGIRRNEPSHPDRFAIRRVLEQHAEITIFDFAKDKLSGGFPHGRLKANSGLSALLALNAVTLSRRNSGDIPNAGPNPVLAARDQRTSASAHLSRLRRRPKSFVRKPRLWAGELGHDEPYIPRVAARV
jgi:hypothetical protein